MLISASNNTAYKLAAMRRGVIMWR